MKFVSLRHRHPHKMSDLYGQHGREEEEISGIYSESRWKCKKPKWGKLLVFSKASPLFSEEERVKAREDHSNNQAT